MARNFTDTIKATSEEDAERQIYRLYPDAVDAELVSRQSADGTESSQGRFFVFEVTFPQNYEEFDLAPEDLGEEEY